MAVKIACPNPACGTNYQVPEQKLGTTVQCKKCGQSFTLRMSIDETSKAANQAMPPPLPSQRPATVVEPPAERSPAAGESSGGPLPFKKLGPYLVRKRLGGGAMGEVWLAHDPDLRRDVAIKTLRPEYAANPEYLQRFLREASSAAQFHHHNTVAIYQVGAEGTTAYIAMELVDGSSLDDVVKLRGRLPWREATEIIRDAASGLAAAHKKGLVHRDVKPANLMRDVEGVTKVVDFGLARAASAGTEISQKGALLGTPAYMAPELWVGQPADARSDLYALVLTYYCLLTGRPPFEAEQSIQVGYQHRCEPLPDARALVPGLPGRLVQILNRGAAKEPEQRYQSAGELLADLDGLLAMPQAGASLSDNNETLVKPPPPSPNRVDAKPASQPAAPPWRGGFRKWAISLGGAAAACLCAVIIYLQTNNGTVQIELSDPQAAVQVDVDGETIQVSGLEKPLTVRVGKHHLLVQGPDFETVGQSFTVKRGERTPLKVTLVPKPADYGAKQPDMKPEPPESTLGAKSENKLQSTAPSPPPAPPLAIAPFDAQQARAYQEAWAKHLGTQVETDGAFGMKLVLIPPGDFLMGSNDGDDEKPPHRVKITRPYYLGVTEVTQSEWKSVMATEPWKGATYVREGADYAASYISWEDATEFCSKLTTRERSAGRLPTTEAYRLPTEAEWEYACRAGTTSKYSFGEDESELGNYGWYGGIVGDGNAKTEQYAHQVAKKRANPWGLYDMHGNVWEWCQDVYDKEYYGRSLGTNPVNLSGAGARVLRGGSWGRHAVICRAANRDWIDPGDRYDSLGFRVARGPSVE